MDLPTDTARPGTCRNNATLENSKDRGVLVHHRFQTFTSKSEPIFFASQVRMELPPAAASSARWVFPPTPLMKYGSPPRSRQGPPSRVSSTTRDCPTAGAAYTAISDTKQIQDIMYLPNPLTLNLARVSFCKGYR